MNLAQMLSVLSALAAAVWSVWTWSEEQQKDRQIKRDQEAALYVNAFILALEELQSLLYRILEEDELAFYKQEYREQYEFGSPAAIEFLYHLSHSIFKFFQVDITGIVRRTSYARYCKEGVGSRRPNWRWLMCFLELPKAHTSCKAFVKRLSLSWGSSDDTKSSMTSTRHSTCTFDRRLPTVYAGRLFLSWRCWSGCRKRL